MDQVNEFVLKFKNQYSDADKIEMTSETPFRLIGSWDSLTGMAVLVMIQDEYGIDITAEKFRELNTINDVYNFILENTIKQ
jgi:acyl carrier protein